MAKSKSSRRWLDRHFNDEFVKRAQAEGYRSRASFKLLELQEKYQLIRRGDCVVDLGAAPGGWSQVATKIVGPQGCVIALDILPMDPLAEVEFIQGDFRESGPLGALDVALNGRPVDIVISDMAPNVSGMAAVDQPKSMYLCELALDFARNVLRPGGALVVKVFQGEGFDEYLKEFRSSFKQVASRKPKASRQNSREVYLVGTNFTV